MAEVFNPILYGHPVVDQNFRTIARILYDITSGEGIPTTRITDAAITADKIAANVITAAKIAANTITATEIAALTITAAEIAASTITATELNVTQLSAIAANVGTLTAGTITSGVGLGAAVRKIYDTDIATACTSVTLSSLTGDTDIEYVIFARWLNDDLESSYGVRLNNDSANNYGWQTHYGGAVDPDPGTCNAYQDTSFDYLYLGRAAAGEYSQGGIRLYAKSGHIRQAIGQYSRSVSGTTITGLYSYAGVWSNTADEITSMVFLSDQATQINAGSHIEVWKRVD